MLNLGFSVLLALLVVAVASFACFLALLRFLPLAFLLCYVLCALCVNAVSRHGCRGEDDVMMIVTSCCPSIHPSI